MLFVLVVAFVATVGFYRRAREIGVHPGKSASVPFIAAGVLIAVTHICGILVGYLTIALDVPENTMHAIGTGMDWSLILAYIVFIKRNWGTLTAV